MARHFSSVAEMRRFYIELGGGLTVLSVGLYAWSFRGAKQEREDSTDVGMGAARMHEELEEDE
jgi:hypothetical protein